MGRFPRVTTRKMWSVVHRGRGLASYNLMRREEQPQEEERQEDQRWTRVSTFRTAAQASEALDEAVASGDGEMDHYRIDEQSHRSRHRVRTSNGAG